MKSVNKRSDARSYSPLSLPNNPHTIKHSNPEPTKTKPPPSDTTALLTLKPPHLGGYSKSILSCNYTRNRKKATPSNLNQTVVHENSINESFCEENAANLSYVDLTSNKNNSQYQDIFRTSSKEREKKNRASRNENSFLGAGSKRQDDFRSTLFPSSYQAQMFDNLFPNVRND